MSRVLRIKLTLVSISILFFSGFIVYSLIYIPIDSEKNFVTPKILYASRGDIYSCNYQLMSTSPIMYNIGIDPVFAKKKNKNFNQEIKELSIQLADKGYQYQDDFLRKIQKCLSSDKRYLLIKKHASVFDKKDIKSFSILKKGNNYGYVEEVIKTNRLKPNDLIASKVLGKVDSYKNDKAYLQFGEKQRAKSGLELTYDFLLRGQDGYFLQKKIKNNISKPLPSLHTIYPKDGKDIVTTIDLRIQELAHNSLLDQLKNFDARFGTVVILDVKSGHVKAMVNLGTLNSTSFEEDWNYAVLGNPFLNNFKKMEPGSTFKLASYLAYFEDGGNPNDTINTMNGIYKVPNTTKKIIDSEKNLGVVNLKDAFATSSNVAVARMVLKKYKDSPAHFLNHIKNFGLDQKSDIDLNYEPNAYISNPTDLSWSEISLPWMSYGYGINLTPLQTLTFYNAIANNGIRISPILVTHYIDGGDTIPLNRKFINNQKICSQETLKKAHLILRNVITTGTAKKLNDLSTNVSGKTGTTVTNYDSKNVLNKMYQSSFVGFFPSEKPKYSCIVLIDNPNPDKGYYGSDVALPVFRKIVEGLTFNDTIYVNALAISDSILIEGKKLEYNKL
tara:strand:+ start:425 stop:2266 length:1842 start_codon:yes stop_codon:yes gene_type:complete